MQGAEALAMAEKSARRLQLERSLEADPGDGFLQYGLAVQCLREGDTEEGRQRLRALIRDGAEEAVAACQQLGQSHVEEEEYDEARAVLRDGIARARAAGNTHAASEMMGLLEQVG